MYKTPGYAGAGTTIVEAKEFGDHITADHVVLRRDSKNVIEEARLALVIKDVATSFMYACPSALKSEEECHLALVHFVSHKDSVGQFYSDNAQELIKSVESLGWRHELSKAYVHQSNAIAERPCNYGGHKDELASSRFIPRVLASGVGACVFNVQS